MVRCKLIGALASICISLLTVSAEASPLMIDFGGLEGAAGTGDTGPGHAEGTINSDYFDWLHYNASTTSLTSETLCKSDCFSTAGITVSFENPPNSSVIDWDGFGWIGKNVVHDVAAGGELDNAAAGDSVRGSQNGHASGIRFDLDPGQYLVYVSAGSDLVGHLTSEIYAGSTASGTSTSDFSGFASTVLTTSNKQTWELGNNYARFLIDVALGESLLVVSDNIDDSEQAIWSTLQIVDASTVSSVPIPATLPLLASILGGLGLLARHRSTRAS